MTATLLGEGADGLPRCSWCLASAQYVAYHDEEWGVPVTDDTRLFEKVSLEAFQSGLSWRTILAKRENFRAAFAGFDVHQVARFGEADVARLLADAGIVRHRGKVEAVIHNAGRAIAMQQEFGSLAAFFWSYKPTGEQAFAVRGSSDESIAMAKALKQRGWKFVGPTTAYALMQAMGLVNDHAPGCAWRQRVADAQARIVMPRHE